METPRSEQFDDIYFAVENGLEESRYVFLAQNNLPDAWMSRSRFTIAETGFGTGLNFLCAWSLFEETAPANHHLTYISFEKFPLTSADILKYLGHWSGEFGGRLERLAALYPLRVGGWHRLAVSPRVTLLLIFDDVNRAIPELDAAVDCWFLDGHAPAKNPDMWSDILFQSMGRLSRRGARFATFTAAGFVRRGIAAAGFQVSKARGYGRKRDMSVGVFMGDGLGDVRPAPPDAVAVIGGGIAGASLVAALTQRGATVDLYDERGLASGASGNIRGLFNPRISAQRDAEADFYSSGFAYSYRMFHELACGGLDIGFEDCGALHFVTDEQKAQRYARFVENWGWPADDASLVSRDEARTISGVPVRHDALYLPHSGMVSPVLVVPALAEAARQIYTERVNELQRSSNGWVVNGRSYSHVVLASAHDVTRFPEAAFLPLQKVRGQVSIVDTPLGLSALQTNLCYGGYASHPFGGKMVVGSTFQHWLDTPDLRDEDHHYVLEKLAECVEGVSIDAVNVTGGRVGFRCAAKDRRPVVGALDTEKGLYISAAHGSHGLVSAPVAAEYIAAQIYGDILPAPRSVITLLAPDRFKAKS